MSRSWVDRQYATIHWHLGHMEDLDAQYDADLHRAFSVGEGIRVVDDRPVRWPGDEHPVLLPDLRVEKPKKPKPPRIFVRVRRRKKK